MNELPTLGERRNHRYNATFLADCREMIETLTEEGPLTMKEIEMVCNIGNSQATNRVELLRDKGLIARERDPNDKRKVQYRIATREEYAQNERRTD